MKCPRCVQTIHRAAEACPHCGFELADADERFGRQGLVLRTLTDRSGLMRRGDRERVVEAMEKFNRRFPQLFVAIHTDGLGELANLRQYGFWILNRCRFGDLPEGKTNDSGILLAIDPQTKAACMVFGYLLEPFLNEDDTFECLARAHGHWLDGRYADGIIRVLSHLESVMMRRSRQVWRRRKHYAVADQEVSQ